MIRDSLAFRAFYPGEAFFESYVRSITTQLNSTRNHPGVQRRTPADYPVPSSDVLHTTGSPAEGLRTGSVALKVESKDN